GGGGDGWDVDCGFFVQAEDGIRDRNVTGVQTCALPISTGLYFAKSSSFLIKVLFELARSALPPNKFGTVFEIEFMSVLEAFLVRSEERRVGKEGRPWWRRPASQRWSRRWSYGSVEIAGV